MSTRKYETREGLGAALKSGEATLGDAILFVLNTGRDLKLSAEECWPMRDRLTVDEPRFVAIDPWLRLD
jgi:hypothetical protein